MSPNRLRQEGSLLAVIMIPRIVDNETSVLAEWLQPDFKTESSQRANGVSDG